MAGQRGARHEGLCTNCKAAGQPYVACKRVGTFPEQQRDHACVALLASDVQRGQARVGLHTVHTQPQAREPQQARQSRWHSLRLRQHHTKHAHTDAKLTSAPLAMSRMAVST